MSEDQSKLSEPATTLLTLRLVWAAMLSGQVVFLVVIAVLWGSGSVTVQPAAGNTVFYAAAAMLAGAMAAGPVIRNQIYKAHWRGEAVLPRGYFSGNLILLAMLEAASFAGLIAVLLYGRFSFHLAVPVIAMAIQVINFPTGRAMEPDRVLVDGKRQE